MSIEAEGLEDWIGSEVVDADDDKLGKVSEVYYRDQDPIIVEIRSGLIGRKYYLAALAGATVSMKHLRLSGTPVESEGMLDGDMLQALAQDDPRLANTTLDQLESGTARKERLEAAREAAARASALETEATHRQEEAKVAAKVAKQAQDNADAAEQASQSAAQAARKARQHADELAGHTPAATVAAEATPPPAAPGESPA